MLVSVTEAQLWRINLFGSLEVRDPHGRAHPIGSRKSAELLAYLCLRKNTVVDRDSIADALWPDVDPMTGRNRLKATLNILRREVDGLPIATHGKRLIELNRERLATDFEICERRMKWRRSLSGAQRAAFAKQMLDMIGSPLLVDLDVPWVVLDRDRYLAIRDELTAELATFGNGVDGGFRLDDQWSGVDVQLVGRERELDAVGSWLADATQRSLYLVGTPGVGKTRILREAIERAGAHCDASIALSTVQASESPWLDRLAQALSIQRVEEVTPALTQLLAGFSRPLLVLDDADQASPEMTEWVESLMLAVPHLRLLATARRRPDLPAVFCEIEPLATKSAGENPSVELLLNFARHFGVREADIQANAEAMRLIARRLDGLPLALEIAAAWMPIIKPGALWDRLSSSSDLITKSPGAGRTTLTSIMGSICLALPDDDRDALVALSLCHGGCGEALAEEMLGKNWFWRIRTLLDRSLAIRLGGIVENRFLVVQALRDATIEIEDAARVEAMAKVRSDACVRLTKRVYFQLNEGDRRYWLGWLRDEGDNLLAVHSELASKAAGVYEAIDAFGRMRAAFWLIGRLREFRNVMSRLVMTGVARFAAELQGAPAEIINHRIAECQRSGDLRGAVDLARRFVIETEAEQDSLNLAFALDREGDARSDAGDFDGARLCWTRCAEHFEASGYRRHALWIQSKLIKVDLQIGDLTGAMRRRFAAFDRARQLGDENSVGIYSKAFAALALDQRRFAEGLDLAEASVAAFRRSGESVTLAHGLTVLAGALLANNRNEDALAALAEARTVDPDPDEEYFERQEFLTRLATSKVNGRLFYDHVLAEH